ncbi:MAG: VOC family protein [Thiotrichales bacterium]
MSEEDSILSLHHASVLVADVARSLEFYSGVLGLRTDPARPLLGFDGAWLRVNAEQQIHLLRLPNPDPVSGRAEHVGRDRHVALTVRDLVGVRARLDAAGIPYTQSRSGRAAVFCRDPDGNGVELIQAGATAFT